MQCENITKGQVWARARATLSCKLVPNVPSKITCLWFSQNMYFWPRVAGFSPSSSSLVLMEWSFVTRTLWCASMHAWHSQSWQSTQNPVAEALSSQLVHVYDLTVSPLLVSLLLARCSIRNKWLITSCPDMSCWHSAHRTGMGKRRRKRLRRRFTNWLWHK